MRRVIFLASTAMIMAAAAPSFGAAPTRTAPAATAAPKSTEPRFAPTPAWVKPVAAPAPSSALANEPVVFLLVSAQERIHANRVENYILSEFAVQNQVGAQGLSTFTMPWNPDVSTLTIHSVQILRGDKVIDVLDPSAMRVIQQEDQLKSSTQTGLHVATMPIKALQVGDRLRMAVTYDTKVADFAKAEELQNMRPAVKVQKASWWIYLSPDVKARWKTPKDLAGEPISSIDGMPGRRFELLDYEPSEDLDNSPARLNRREVQLTAYNSWGEVAEPMIPFYAEGRKLSVDSPVKKLAAEIAAKNQQPEQKMLAALRVVQDQVRYVALLLQDGRYRPDSADAVWEQRFGDCKGKTALLLALLDELGIAADPVLAGVKSDALVGDRLPSLASLDHVFVRARIGSTHYYLDGTNLGQRTVDELKQAPVRFGIPVVPQTNLATFPNHVPELPLRETQLTWDTTSTLHDEVPFKARLILRGVVASEMRVKAQAGSTDKDFLENVKNLVTGVDNDDLKLVASNAEESDGSYSFEFNGKADLDWRPVDGMKGNRFDFSQSTLRWNVDFKRDKDHLDIPISLPFPYWERMVETVILPDGGKDFFVDAKPISNKLAGVEYRRTASMQDGKAVSVSDFKRMVEEIDAKEANAAKAGIEEVNDDVGYVVAKRKLKLPKD